MCVLSKRSFVPHLLPCAHTDRLSSLRSSLFDLRTWTSVLRLSTCLAPYISRVCMLVRFVEDITVCSFPPPAPHRSCPPTHRLHLPSLTSGTGKTKRCRAVYKYTDLRISSILLTIFSSFLTTTTHSLTPPSTQLACKLQSLR
jgi:hypothetical protein